MASLTIEQIKENGKPLIKKFTEAGIKADLYARPIIGKDALVLSLINGRKLLKVWPGIAEISIFPDKKQKQVVLRSVEKERTFVYSIKDSPDYRWEKNLSRRAREMTRDFWNLTSDDKIKVLSVTETLKPLDYDPVEQRSWLAAEVEVTRPRTEIFFLIGKDEQTYFISQLPKPCYSVSSAHKALRPVGLSKNAVRQGEWFFNPLTIEEVTRLLSKNPDISKKLRLSDHHAQYGITEGRYTDNETQYVMGKVYHSPGKRHKDLFFPTWHKVVRNLEIESSNALNWD